MIVDIHAKGFTVTPALAGRVRRRLAFRRRDIAGMLGVAHETVSRSFGSLTASGCVAVTGRTVDILDAAALQGAARSSIALQPLTMRGDEGAPPHRVSAVP